MKNLSARQLHILKFISGEIKEKGYPPTVREIRDNVGIASSSTVHDHLSRLESEGVISRDPSKPRTIEITDGTYLKNEKPKYILNVRRSVCR